MTTADARAAAEVLAAAHARAGRPAPRPGSSSTPPPPPAAAPEEEPRPNSPEDLGVRSRPRPAARAARPPADPFPGAALVSSQASAEGWSVVLLWPDDKTSEHFGRDRAAAEARARDFCARRAAR